LAPSPLPVEWKNRIANGRRRPVAGNKATDIEGGQARRWRHFRAGKEVDNDGAIVIAISGESGRKQKHICDR
jgi:hypothetical protein